MTRPDTDEHPPAFTGSAESRATLEAHLYSVGITPDSRNLKVLLVGDTAMLVHIGELLDMYGADACGCDYAAENWTGPVADVLISDRGFILETAKRWLRPGGKYLVLIDGVGGPVTTDLDSGVQWHDLVMTNVESVGGGCVRIEGLRPMYERESQNTGEERGDSLS